MERQLKCFLLLSLKEMALRRVAVSLWNDPEILSSILKAPLWAFKDLFGGKKLPVAFTEKIINQVLKLLLPRSLMKQLTASITPIGLEIEEWKKAHQSFLNSACETGALGAAKLCWTTAGTINYHKTAEELMRCSKIDIEVRYEIACYYCLEDYISLFWMELPERAKEKYSKGKDASPLLPYCWPHILQGRHSELDYLWRECEYNRMLSSFNQCAFEFYAKESCKTAAKYFLQKLTLEERKASLMRSFYAILKNNVRFELPNEKISDVLLFLLSAMTPHQQLEAIKVHPVWVFIHFLQWPLQDLFSENADFFWTLLPPSEYEALINETLRGYHLSHFYFPKMFKEFITQSPQNFKKFFVEENFLSGTRIFKWRSGAAHFLTEFLEKRDEESIRVFFRNLDSADRVKIVCRYKVLKLFYEHVLGKEGCYLVALCLREASLSKELVVKIKEFFMSHLKCNPNRMNVEWEFQYIFDSLKESDSSSSELKRGEKRKLENCSPEQ